MNLPLEGIITTVTPILKSNDVNYAAVFGSYARNEATADSDVDLLISFAKPKSLITMCGIERSLSEALHKKVDLVTKQSLSPYIQPYIEKDLQLIYEEK